MIYGSRLLLSPNNDRGCGRAVELSPNYGTLHLARSFGHCWRDRPSWTVSLWVNVELALRQNRLCSSQDAEQLEENSENHEATLNYCRA